MQRRTPALSADDQKAVDVCLDHAASAGKTRLTRMATPVQQRRLMAVTKVLALLAELPATDPPEDLVARTLRRIDQHRSHKIVQSMPDAVSRTLH